MANTLQPARSWSDYRQLNLYDAFPLNIPHSCHIFGNANVGNRRLSNLQVPGQCTHDHETGFVIQRWYARSEVPITPIMTEWFNNVPVTFIMGEKPQWTLSLAELTDRRPRYVDETQHQQLFDPFPVIVPPRQNISVMVDPFCASRDEDHHTAQRRAVSAAGSTMGAYTLPGYGGNRAPMIWIHLEGVLVKYNEVAPLLDRMLRKQRSVEERICDYILRMAGDDDDALAQATALTDGIKERRHQ